ncbi:MAG: hypothetical protein ACRDJW_25505 [Thermomicrobiales bacterium]
MSDLPARVTEAGLLLHRASILSDPEALQRVIDWGHEQIDIAYLDDPLRAPLNLYRRLRAHQEWDKVVQTTGRDLRGTIMSSLVKELEFEIERRQEDIRARDAERRRQEAARHDSQLRVDEHERISAIDLDRDRARLQRAHGLHEQAEDAASRRRREERTHDVDLEITAAFAAAIVEAIGPNPTDDMIDSARKIGHEIAAIRANPHLTDDDKHLQIQILIKSLERRTRSLRAHDV